MARGRSKLWTIFLRGTAALLLLAGSCAGYVGYRGHDAKRRVAAFCANVSVGQSSAGIADKARGAGLDVLEMRNRIEGLEPTDTILCTKGVLVFARQVCGIDHRAGVVTRVQTSFDD